MSISCPCCGQPMIAPRAPIEGLSSAPLRGQHRIIVETLVRAYPRAVEQHTLIDALYSDRRDGGPDNPVNVIATCTSRLRPLLERYGWTIPRSRSGSGNRGRYRLQPVTEEKVIASIAKERT